MQTLSWYRQLSLLSLVGERGFHTQDGLLQNVLQASAFFYVTFSLIYCLKLLSLPTLFPVIKFHVGPWNKKMIHCGSQTFGGVLH